MKLISMTDFVLGTESDLDKYNPIGLAEDLNNRYQGILNYAKFLKKPLKLEMFVPCDDDGNLLEEPEQDDLNMSWFEKTELYIKEKQYRQAKERTLFEYKAQFDIGVIKHHISQNRTIEYLANFGELTLTPTALKQIGLT